MLMLDRITGLLAPHTCIGCGAEGDVCCCDCLQRVSPAVRCCYRCQKLGPNFATCPDCRLQSPLTAVYAAAAYDGLTKDLLWRLKFDRALAAAPLIARQLHYCLSPLPKNALVVPVPTARSRVRRRGYDQAELLAAQYARMVGVQYCPLLERLGSGEQKGANRQQRQEQLQSAYRVRARKLPRSGLAGRIIVLVDDVVTTGATLEAAAAALSQTGARAVHGLVFAQVW